jgi:hypothetical protein
MTFIIISFSSGFDSAIIIVSAASADIYSIVETDTYALSDGSAFAKQKYYNLSGICRIYYTFFPKCCLYYDSD